MMPRAAGRRTGYGARRRANPSLEVVMEQESSNRSRIIAAAVLAVAVVAVAFYFIGRAVANPSGEYAKGVQDGREDERARFERGKPGYQRIYLTGYRAGRDAGLKTGETRGERLGAERGEKAGFERGERVGALRGDQEGITAGGRAALGGFSDWETGTLYVVQVGPGEQGLAFRVVSRHEMLDDRRYALCADDPGQLCSRPIRGQ
jgi:hypothetical protein